jgi:hypothetical protein
MRMKIEFSNSFEEMSEKKLHITREDVIRTVKNPLRKQTVAIDDLKVLLFLQKERSGDKYLLVTGEYKDETLIVGYNCFKLLPELILKAGNLEPIILLQQLVFNFGLPIKVGNRVDKFFFREAISVPRNASPSSIVRFMLPQKEMIATMFMRMREDEEGIDCALVYSIDLISYINWLNKKTVVQVGAQIYDVFISYKRTTGKSFALFLKECLVDEGYRAFLDLKDIPKEFEGTEKWFEVRDEAIRNSKRFLLLITIKIESSKEVAEELSLARKVPTMKFMYLRHEVLKPQILIKLDNETIDLSEGNQEPFSTEDDLARKVLKILEDSKTE